MTTSADPYLLASTILTPDEHPKLALVTYDPTAHSTESEGQSSAPPPAHTQRIFVIVSNVSFGVEQSCVLVIKPRRKDPTTAALLSVIPILPDLKIEIEPQQGLTASAAIPRNHPPAATILGLSSLPQSLPTIHTLLESVVPDLFADKADKSNAALRLTLSYGGQSASGITSDARGLKDFLSVLKDLLKIAQEHAFSSNTTHQWMGAYTDDLSSHSHGHHQQQQPATALDTPIFSRFSHSAFQTSTPAPQARPRPASPTADDIRISACTFNVNGHLPHDDIPTIIGLKKWLRAEEDPDLIITGFQEVDTSGGAYLYYSPAREEAWTRAITQALGRRAEKYEKLASKQLVGLMILVFARTSIRESISEVATASVGVGLGGFVANKGAVAVRLQCGQRSMCFVNSHLSAFEGLQAMERRCWDWNEIYKRLRFRVKQPEMEDFWETPGAEGKVEQVEENGGSDQGNLSASEHENPFKTAQDAHHEEEIQHDGLLKEDKIQLQDATSTKDLPPDTKSALQDAINTEAITDDQVAALQPTAGDSATINADGTSSPSHHIEHTILEHDIVINFGDLNFRLDLSHSETHRLIRSRQYDTLHRYDQLESLRSSGSLFDDFEEGKIDFAPTYKFDKGTDRYDTSEKQRVPAWTDRILWAVTKEWETEGNKGDLGKSATGESEGRADGEEEKRRLDKQRKQGVVLQSYESVPDLKFSDHRPVRATFLVRVR